ncbi:MAG: tetratricopeptide repeat protein [Symploca sp. SIO2B6]|nr:tetratricopeptide repeat protein [Symploca sp. SIO2B6]
MLPAQYFNDRALRDNALSEAKAGNYADAIALFDQLLQQNPLSAADYNNRGLVHFQNHQHDEALADYNRAIDLDAELANAYDNRGNYYAHHGDLFGALLDYDMAIDLNPFSIKARINQGITFRELKIYGRAVECFDTALQFSRLKKESIYLERGRTHHLRGDWNCAIADYQRAMTSIFEKESDLSNRELTLLNQAQDWIDQLLTPLQSA